MTTGQRNRGVSPIASIGVLVCTFRRTKELSRCLGGLEAQVRKADEVMVVVRQDDLETIHYLQSRQPETLPLRILTVGEPGLVAARNVGAQAVQTDVLAITDDDAVPHPDWLERIFVHFATNPHLGGLGGRDQCFVDGHPQPASKDLVGKLLWNGKHVGNHHLGRGVAREVDLLKGVNMSYRREVLAALRFDERLRGRGAQACEDLAFSRSVAVAGWTLLYDPEVVVDHYEGARDEPRHYSSQMMTDPIGFENSVYNQVVATWSSLSQARRVASLLYFAVIGTRSAPGIVQAVRFTRSQGLTSWVRFVCAQKARLAAYWNLSKEHEIPLNVS